LLKMGVLTGAPPRIIACIFTSKIVFLTTLCTWYTRKKIREMRFISNIKFGGSEAFKKSGKEGANDFWKRAMRENSTREALNSTKRKLPSNSNGGLSSSSPTRQVSTAVKASSNAVAQSSSSSSLNVPPMMKSALTSAGLGIVGDCVAQTLQRKPWEKKEVETKKKNSQPADEGGYDYPRTARQSLFNLTFYGPLQHVWYIFLGQKWPTVPGSMAASNLSPFATKVFLNQAVLGPVVVVCFFAWSQVLTNAFTVNDWTHKVQRDALPTLQRGWAFWVPASAINFALVPVNKQVLYMSCCSIVWNCILSQAGNKKGVQEDKKKK